jgi:hypothetical protein
MWFVLMLNLDHIAEVNHLLYFTKFASLLRIVLSSLVLQVSEFSVIRSILKV